MSSNSATVSTASAVRQSSKNGSKTRAQPMLQVAGRPDEQSSVASSQHSSLRASVLEGRSVHCGSAAAADCSSRPTAVDAVGRASVVVVHHNGSRNATRQASRWQGGRRTMRPGCTSVLKTSSPCICNPPGQPPLGHRDPQRGEREIERRVRTRTPHAHSKMRVAPRRNRLDRHSAVTTPSSGVGVHSRQKRILLFWVRGGWR